MVRTELDENDEAGTLSGAVPVPARGRHAGQPGHADEQRLAGLQGRIAGVGQDQGNSLIKPKWAEDVPIYVRGMVLGGQKLFIVGPPDIIDEEATFKQLTEKDPEVQKLLELQDQMMDGKDGALLLSVNIDTGEVEHRLKIDSLPGWDGLAGANEKLFMSTLDGRVICFGTPK